MAVLRGAAIVLTFGVVLVAACGGNVSIPAESKQFDDAWLWDGADWTEVHTTAAPPSRILASVAYDRATHEVVLFGGTTYDGTSFLNDTWTWNGGVWTKRHPAHSPEARSEAGLVYDPSVGALVLIGGFVQKPLADGSTFVGGLDDIWKWNGSDWSLVGHSHFPLYLSGSGLSGFDPASKEVVAVGDLGTLSWDHTTWRVVTNPPAWQGAEVTYVDPTSGALTALADFTNPDYSLTYRLESWNGARWVASRIIELPPGGWLDAAGASYDSKRRQIVAFGGGGTSRIPTAQTLVFDGAAWSAKQPMHIPPARSYTYLVFNPDSGLTLMFGGHA